MANIKISELNPLLTVEDADVLPIVDNAVTKKVTAAILRSYTQGNSVLLTGNQTVAGIKTFTSQIASSVSTGTAPFSVASTTKVTNLNADLLDGLSSADFQATLSGTGIVKSTAGTISYLTDNTANWDAAYNDSIVSAGVTGTSTKTLTLNQQDGGTVTASWSDADTGLTSVGLSMPSAFSVANSPLTANGTLAVTGAGTTAQYVRGDGSLATFPSLTGYVPYTGATTNVNLGTHSLTASDLVINHASGSGVAASITKGGSGEALTVVKSSGSGNAASITGGTTLISELNLTTDLADAYIASAATWNAKQNAITLTTTGTSGAATLVGSTLNIPNYADTDTGITSLNGLTALTQTFAVGTSGTDFGISSATSTHTFNLPTASAANRGALSSADWTTFNNKQNALTNPITGTGTTNYLPKFTGASALGNSNLVSDANGQLGIGVTPSAWDTSFKALQIGIGTALYNNTSVNGTFLGSNFYYNGTDNKYIATGTATAYGQINGSHNWFTVASGTAGDTVNFTQAMTLTASGNLLLGTSSNNTGKLQLLGDAYIYKNGEFLANVATNSNQPQYQTWYNSVGATRGYLGYLTNGSNVLSLDNVSGGAISLMGGNVGIGTTTPEVLLHIKGTPETATVLRFSPTSSSTIFSQVVGVNGDLVLSADPNNAEGSTAIKFNIDGTEKMRLFGDGNLVLNSTTNAGYKLDVNGSTRVSSSLLATGGLYTNSLTAGGVMQFNYTNAFSGSRSWRIANDVDAYGDFAIMQSTTQTGSTFANKLIISNIGNATFSSSVTATGGFSSTTGLALSGGSAPASGIEFPATQVASASANNLDDYEEGTFTPSVIGSTSAGTATYTTRFANYTKIGRQVSIQIDIEWFGGTGIGDLSINGLPFNSSGSTNPAVTIGYFDGVTLTALNYAMAYIANSSNRIDFVQIPIGGGAVSSISYDTTARIIVNATYIV